MPSFSSNPRLACVFVNSLFLLASSGSGEETKSVREELALERFVSIDNVCAWPNLTMLRDGTITAIIFGKPSHGQMAGDVECWASSDGSFWEKRGHPAPTIRIRFE